MQIIVNKSKIDELKELLEEAVEKKKNGEHVVCIEVTSSEMKEIVNSKKAKEVIPEYYRPNKEKIDLEEQKMTALRRNQESDRALEQQEFFDKKDVIEERLDYLKSYVPKEISQSGIVIRQAGILRNEK